MNAIYTVNRTDPIKPRAVQGRRLSGSVLWG